MCFPKITINVFAPATPRSHNWKYHIFVSGPDGDFAIIFSCFIMDYNILLSWDVDDKMKDTFLHNFHQSSSCVCTFLCHYSQFNQPMAFQVRPFIPAAAILTRPDHINWGCYGPRLLMILWWSYDDMMILWWYDDHINWECFVAMAAGRILPW